jgi:hypothetical protein
MQTSERLDPYPSPFDTLTAQNASLPILLEFEKTSSIQISHEEECPPTQTGVVL